MADDLPPPPVPLDADLSNFPFTPIYRARLFGSAFHARASDAEWRGGLTLWLKSQDQRPAGSLPDDDTELCRLAELGRDLKAWRKIKAGALHGWFPCSDGRLYHKTVAETVCDQWNGKTAQRQRTLKARIAACEKRLLQATDERGKADLTEQLGALRQELSQALSPSNPPSVTVPVTEVVTSTKGEGEGDRKGEGLSNRGAEAPAGYAFVGRVIRLKAKDLDHWRASYSAIPDMLAELQSADAYYSENPPKSGKWFFPVANWLKRAHESALGRAAPDAAYAGYRGID